ncbi:MAG TPA: hypothetical protein VFG09_03900 [Thermodesulfovibrionales bacterium]|nr:hypothetical protein [Thermodesulfovibrionales bacterium]
MASHERDRGKRFYPDYLVEILFVVFLVTELTLALALLYPPEIGRQIDFSAQYQPKPEWYFLWSYQLVRYFPGNTTFIGTVLIPSLAVLALILIPYIDRGRHGRLRASLVGMFLLLAFVLFTVIPALSQ